jgi:GntR family transcriptional regulator
VYGDSVIEFRIDSRSGVAPYHQIVQQVRQALRLGMLQVGDQLPTVKEVAAQVAINPNTVLKAYGELEHEGLVEGRPGLGTFITRSLEGESLASHQRLRTGLQRWLGKARAAGLDDDTIAALFDSTFRSSRGEDVA